ncbi:MAG TPA: hypothetical protein PLV27_07520 [Anaerolineaceae bacterium]|nr:hypothetical protein [Anaerolineaceae bacterium]HOV07091.1 hypothetical protein [Anaerolineaceae bacterium]
MVKKILWIFILLLMTACTIVFSRQADPSSLTTTPVAEKTIGTPVDDSSEILSTEGVVTPQQTILPGEGEEITEGALPTRPLFSVQSGTPSYLANFNELDKGCAWQGVAGQVFGIDKRPIKYLIVKVFGTWNGEEVNQEAVTGMVAGKPYGKGGYEVVLGDVAVDSVGTLFIQLFDSNGVQLTEPFAFNTRAKCNRNLVLINFVAN